MGWAAGGLKFEKMDDFLPLYRDGETFGGLVKQVPKLWELFQKRQDLNDLLAKLDMKTKDGKTLDDALFEELNPSRQLAAGAGGDKTSVPPSTDGGKK